MPSDSRKRRISMMHTVLQNLSISVPIIQAPMAGTATPELAAAVSNAGGLGSLGVGSSTVEQARTAIQQTRALTPAAFNVNFFCHQTPQSDPARETVWLTYLSPLFQDFDATPPARLHDPYTSFKDNPAMLDMLLQERPPVVSFHFGLPPDTVIQKLKAAGIVLMATATTLVEAQAIESAGVDVIVAQGVEAGGHRGVFDPHGNDQGLTTLALTNLLATRCQLPIVAAGGIMDGRGVQAVMQLGACAAQMGTAFILCPESAASAAYRNALGSSNAFNTRITAAVSGRPARGIVNRMHRDVDRRSRPALPDYPICYTATKALQQAARNHDNHEFESHWAGQGAPLARAMPAAELMKTLAREIDL